jgi:hypothetical protein
MEEVAEGVYILRTSSYCWPSFDLATTKNISSSLKISPPLDDIPAELEPEPETLLNAAIKAYQRKIDKVKEEVNAIMEQQELAQKAIEVAREAASAAVQVNPRRKQARKSREANAAIQEAQERHHAACKKEVTTRERLRVLTGKLAQMTASVDESEDE